ncbi:hypothetical protein [Methylorubrum extorquens]|uniref:hypothetical protein n=1 Tax=Methylorubrum extorquens TaxID=408 RepID=UPI002238C8AB|nr:hypothetical protein [Methylorubrum extorquens]UYW33604.1 hypothetical protein OKB92_05855 [Methylorubrum extorquens]
MDASQIATSLAAQLDAIRQAPLPFLAAIIVVFLAAWKGARHLYDNQIKALEARLKLKEDEAGDYKRKLEGASPDEAKERLEALQHRVQQLEVALQEVGETDFVKIFEEQMKNTKFIVDGGRI